MSSCSALYIRPVVDTVSLKSNSLNADRVAMAVCETTSAKVLLLQLSTFDSV